MSSEDMMVGRNEGTGCSSGPLFRRKSQPPSFRKKTGSEEKANPILLLAVIFTVAVLFFIIIFISYYSLDAINEIGLWEFLTGAVWSPNSGAYGALSLLAGTFLVTGGSILFALPMGVGIAIYINDVASPRVKKILKPACELFAGIPSVVYGFIGLVLIIPLLMDVFPDHLSYGSSWLAGSILLGIMALPTIISVSQDAMGAVPRSYREASIALGATKWETTKQVVIRSAMSGIAAAAILGIGRALGETMAIMMVTGNSALIPDPLWNIFDMVRTMTASIALEMGEVVFGSLHQSALFLLALILMVIVVFVNLVARHIVKMTKRKMGEGFTGKDGRGSRLQKAMAERMDPFKPIIIKMLALLFVFAMAAMMSSLFIGMAGGLMVGLLSVFSCILCVKVSKRAGPGRSQKAVYSGLWVLVAGVMLMLVAIIGIIVVNGLPALNFDFIFTAPSKSGTAGGIWPAIVGTLELMAGTALMAFPLGICSGVYLSRYAKNTRYIGLVRHAVDALNGTPSIIFGLFGMSVLVIWLGLGYSLLGGCITLSLMILPTIIRTTEESLDCVPMDLTEASMALGASKWHTICKVVIPAAMGGIITGLILSVGRAIGETAPIMFTAAVAFKSTAGFALLEPIMALPYHLYYLASEVPGSTANQYGTALVLLMIVVVLFAAASLVRNRYSKRTGW